MDSFKNSLQTQFGFLLLQIGEDQEMKDPQSYSQFSGRARSKTLSSRHLIHCFPPTPIPIPTSSVISYHMGACNGKIVMERLSKRARRSRPGHTALCVLPNNA